MPNPTPALAEQIEAVVLEYRRDDGPADGEHAKALSGAIASLRAYAALLARVADTPENIQEVRRLGAFDGHRMPDDCARAILASIRGEG